MAGVELQVPVQIHPLDANGIIACKTHLMATDESGDIASGQTWYTGDNPLAVIIQQVAGFRAES